MTGPSRSNPTGTGDLPLAVTIGDPSGIGPEISIKAIAQLHAAAPAGPALMLIGDTALLDQWAVRLNLPVRCAPLAPAENFAAQLASLPRNQVGVLQVGQLAPDLPVGQVDARAGQAAWEYVAAGAQLALANRIGAIVTAPLNKASLAAAGVPYPGHTEMLAALAGGADVAMMLVNDELRVILVSIHVALADAARLCSRERVLRTIEHAARALRAAGIAEPRIAVAGLNPHAGENGLFGREEHEQITPAIEQARRLGIDASGPWPGDTVFARARGFRDFDIVVAQYHDQGLIPIKYLGIDNGVNVTVGLPFVRTSVDHGTAFDIAGCGVADHRSLLAAIRVAEELTRARRKP